MIYWIANNNTLTEVTFDIQCTDDDVATPLLHVIGHNCAVCTEYLYPRNSNKKKHHCIYIYICCSIFTQQKVYVSVMKDSGHESLIFNMKFKVLYNVQGCMDTS